MVKILTRTGVATPDNSYTTGSAPFGLAAKVYEQAADALPNNTNMSVAPTAGITDTLNLNAQQVAEQNPELHEMRQKFFGQDYLSDLEKGDTGTVQYYTGLGDPNAINYTGEQTTEPVVDTSTPVVDTGGGGGSGQNVFTGGDGIMSTAPAMDQAAAIEAMTQPEAYDIPGTMPLTPVSGAFGPFDYLQPTTPITRDENLGDVGIAEAIAAQDRQDAFDQQFAFEDPKALAARGIEPDSILPEARPDNLLPEGFDPYFSLEAADITPIERTPQLEETPIMYSEFDDLEADPGTQPIEGITPEVQSAWEKVKSGASTAGDFIKNYGTAAYNLLAGSPIGAAASLLTQPFTSSESQIEYESYSPETKQAVDQAYGPGGLMEGYNTVSMMGEGVEATIQDRIDTINETLETKDSKILEDRKTELTNLLNTVQGDKEGQITDRDLDIATGIEAADEEPSPVSTPTVTTAEAPPSILSRPVQTYSPPPARPHGGGGNGGGGGMGRGRDPGGGAAGSPFAKGGLIRKKYSSGGIVDLI